MELENVFLEEEIRKLRDELRKAKVQERKLKDQVDHLLRFVYSSDTCADKDAIIQKKQEEIKKLKQRNKDLRQHINFLYKKTLEKSTKLRF